MKETVMSRISYSNNPTDCNYSFCDDKENMPPNYEELAKILKRHYQLHLKNAHTIRQQATQIQRMQTALASIHQQLSRPNPHPINTISFHNNSSQRTYSHSQLSAEYFPSKPSSRSKQNNSSRCKKNSARGTHSSKQRHSKQSSEYNSRDKSESLSSEKKHNVKLLTSIVERKLNIEKELKERLRKHMLPSQGKTHNYITYATER